MGVISVSLPSDGSTADVADVNAPFTTIVNAINGGLDNTNIASNASIDAAKLADNTLLVSKLNTTSLVPCYKEVTTQFNSGGVGAYTAISALATSFTITTAGTYEVSLLLPSLFSQTTTQQWHLRITSTYNTTTFFNTDTGAAQPVAIASNPLMFYWRRRMTLTAGTYPVLFEWYGNVGGAGNPINVGCGTDQPATFIVKAV